MNEGAEVQYDINVLARTSETGCKVMARTSHLRRLSQDVLIPLPVNVSRAIPECLVKSIYERRGRSTIRHKCPGQNV